MLHCTMPVRLKIKRNMKNKQPTHPLGARLQKVADLLEHLIAVQMYGGGAGQREIAKSLNMSLGTVNKFVKGMKIQKTNHGKE